MNFKNESHKRAFMSKAKVMNIANKELMCKLYLLTADVKLWQLTKRCMETNQIPLHLIHLRPGTEERYILLCCAKDLTMGTKYLSIADLSDSNVISPQMFNILSNAIAIRRFGLDAIQYKGRREGK